MKYLNLALLGILLVFACSKTVDPDPIYETTFTVQLDSIATDIPLDSATIKIYIDGELSQTIKLRSDELDERSIVFAVKTEPGQDVKIEYVVYSGDKAIVNGVEELDPQNPPKLDGELQIDSTVLQEVIDQQKSSSLKSVSSSHISSSVKTSSSSSNSGSSSSKISSTTMSSSGSSSSVASGPNENFTIDFDKASSIIDEDEVATNLLIKITGDLNSKLLTARTVNIFRKGGSADASDYVLIEQVTLPKNATSGFSTNVNLSTFSDELVEGDETIILSIVDDNDLTLGAQSTHTVTIHDADSAWVEFKETSGSIMEQSASVDVGLRLRIVPASASLASAVTVKAVVNATSAVPNSDFSYTSSGSSTTFISGAIDNTEKLFSFNVIEDETRELEDQFTVGLSVTSGPASAAKTSFAFNIENDDYEYVVVLDTFNHKMVFYSPEGEFINQYSNTNLDSKARGMTARAYPSGKVFMATSSGLMTFDVNTLGFTINNSYVTDMGDVVDMSSSESIWTVTPDSLRCLSRSNGGRLGVRLLSKKGLGSRNYAAPCSSYGGVFTASYYDTYGMLGFHNKTSAQEGLYGSGVSPQTKLGTIMGLTSDGASIAWAITASGQLLRYSMATQTGVVTSLSSLALKWTRGLAWSPRNTLYIVDGEKGVYDYRLLEIDANTGALLHQWPMANVKAPNFEAGQEVIYLRSPYLVPKML